jgi:hypothetical protein
MSILSKGSAIIGLMGVSTGYFNTFGKEASAGAMVIGVAGIGIGSALELVEGMYGKKKK